jgi:hypothetical protein
MSPPKIFISKSAIRTFKKGAQRYFDSVPSSHLSEGIAAAFDFRTHAALRSALEGCATTETQRPSNSRLVQRLHQLGHTSIPDDLRLLPELEHSYTPFRPLPLRTRRGVRWHAWRNLLVAAVNAGLEQNIFGLSPGENWWTGAKSKSYECKRGVYNFKVNEEMTAIASVKANSHDELYIMVILNPRKADIEPEWYQGLSDGDAIAHCWLERRLGAWIQDGGEGFRCRRFMHLKLANLAVEPKGYAEQGSFFM